MLNINTFRLNGAQLDKTVQDNLASDSTGYIANTLNTALKNKLVVALNSRGYASVAALLENMPAVDIAASKDISLRAFVANQLQGKTDLPAATLQAISDVEIQLSDTTTVGEWLGLDTPLSHHAVLGDDAQRAVLGALLSTSPVLSSDLQDKFINTYIQHQGKIEDFWRELATLPAFQAPGVIEALQFTFQLDKLTQGNVPLVQAIQSLCQQQGIVSMRDLTKLSADDWKKLITTPVNGQVVPVPSSIAGATRDEQVANYSKQILSVLQKAFPTPYIAQEVARQPVIDLGQLNAVLANNPHLDPSRPLPAKMQWGTISADQQTQAAAAMEALRQEVKAYPAFDHKEAMAASSFHNPVREAVAQFLNNNPEFDFSTTHIDTYFAQQNEKRAVLASNATPSQISQSDLVDQLKRTQRVFQVSQDPGAVPMLLAAGLHSARSIATTPQASFVAQYKNALGGEAQTSVVYARAQQIHATTAHVYTTIHQALHDVSPMVLGNDRQNLQSVLNQNIPNWSTLFGPLDLSDCEDCHSLYSPAAYLVDLLEFLRKTPITGGTLQDVLFARRPDLQYIKLSCENTNTAIPYIDLVNEILETYIAIQTTYDPAITGDPSSPTADELSVNPQHVNNAAYSALLSAVYPFTLPYDRSLEMARIYLANMGSGYDEVMRTFQNNGSPSDVAIACESLHISPEEYAILVDTTLKPTYYGYDPSTNPANLKQMLNQVPAFLQSTGIHYLDLIELLKTRFLNPQQLLTLRDTSPTPDSGDLSTTVITNLDDATLQKLHRFIRLRNKLGWQIRDLDRVLAALGATDIDSTFLRKLAQIRQLLDTLSLPFTTLLSFWSNIETYKYEAGRDDSLYAALFLNKAVLNVVLSNGVYQPVDPAFALNSARSDLLNTGLISDHTGVILAALGITAAELNILTTLVVTDNALNLTNLSMLYRYVSLARALNISISDLIALKTLSSINPFMDSNPTLAGLPATAIRLVALLRNIQQSGFTVAQLNYLYQHLYDPGAGVAPLQSAINLFFQQLSTGLAKIVNDTTVVADPTGDLLRQKLSIILASALVDQAMKIIDGSSTQSQADQGTFIDQNFALFLNAPGSGTSTQEAKSKLLAGSTLSHEDRFAYVLAPLMNYLRTFLSSSLVKQMVSNTFKLAMSVVEALVGGTSILRTHTTPVAYPLMQDFLTFAGTTPAPSLPPAQLYYLLHKIALLINTLGLTVKEIVYVAGHSGDTDFAGFDFNQLPLAQGGFTSVLFDQWQRLADLATLRNGLPSSEVSLVDVFGAAVTNASTSVVSTTTMQQLLAATGWNPIEVATLVGWDAKTLAALIGQDATKLAALVGSNGFKLNDSNFRNATWLLTLQSCLFLGQRLGVSVKHLFDWAAPQTSPQQTQSMAQEIKNTVRAKYDEAQWLVVAKPLNDQLRESQKAALIAYILQMPTIKTQNLATSSDLYENFLIDVDMSACMQTSRILQASSTIQLFVDRCLMGLEPGAATAIIDETVWQWMKRYRTWEANRKVFLYPENFLEPALRDDKSPFYRDLETQLLQQDITMDSAEEAFLDYLEKLDQVARLEVCGMYWETEPDGLDWRNVPSMDTPPGIDVLHVFARSFAVPHIYYYRTLNTSVYISNGKHAMTSTWTAWEKVNLDIEGDHLIPVVYNRRLYLFWPIFKLQADRAGQNLNQGQSSQPNTVVNIQLAWSEYKQGKWTPKQVSAVSSDAGKNGINNRADTTSLQTSQYLFKAALDGDNLDIQVLYTQPPTVTQGPSATQLDKFSLSGSSGAITIFNATTPPATEPLTMPDNSESAFMDFQEIAAGNQNPLVLYASDPQNPNASPQALPTLAQTPSIYNLLYPHQLTQFTLQAPFFYQDDQRTYFVTPDQASNVSSQVSKPQAVIPSFNAQLALSSKTALSTLMPGEPAIFKPASSIVQARVVTEQPPLTAQISKALPAPTALLSSASAINPLAGAGGNVGSGPTKILDGNASPSQLALGIPQTLTISAEDDTTGAAVPATVSITNGTAAGTSTTESHPANQPFTTTFHTIRQNNKTTYPTASVHAAGYPDPADVPLSFTPVLSVSVSPGQIELDVPQTITVSTNDADTSSPVNGTVVITNGTTTGGQAPTITTETYSTNTPFTTVLHKAIGTSAPTAVVNAANHPPVSLQFNVFAPPTLNVTVSPAQTFLGIPQSITVFAIDANTGADVAASVVITNGTASGGSAQETHPANVPFTTTLYLIQGLGGTSTPPTAVVNAPGYTSVPFTFSVIVPPKGIEMRFASYSHFHVAEFVKSLNRSGIDGLLTLANQQLTDAQSNPFSQRYYPSNQVAGTYPIEAPYPVEDVDFQQSGAYSLYNWELFFHIPLMIAQKLSSNQRFEEALHWFQYIFNPAVSGTSVQLPNAYWRTLPFNQNNKASQRIQDLLKQLDSGSADLVAQVENWRQKPFEPYRIARLRISAYQKYVVMKYIDNLIAWGDQLFSQDAMESINEATQLYVLAHQILGPRPERIPPRGTVTDKAYADLRANLDDFSNAMVTLENQFPFSSITTSGGTSGSSSSSPTFYFCIPQNDTLLGYWDIVEDRLFKIRHCLNIAGIVQQLPLFAPPINPALLVQATAMGTDLSSALSDINAAVPHYRFTYMLQKALELCAEVRSLGAALLSALEKKDAEALAVLRATQETSLLKVARFVKEQQLEEAQTNVDGLQKTREVTDIRHKFYENIEFMNDWEEAHLILVGASAILQAIAGVIEIASGTAHAIPDFTAGVAGYAGSAVATVKYGGENVGGALQGFARALGVLAALASTAGAMSATMGGYQRRADEWHLQEQMSAKELEQIDKQIAAANIRIAIAQRELDNHDIQIQNATAVENFMRDKYTNQELYDWMISQASAIFFQCYQMAYDLAKRAEKAFRFERGLTTSDYITFGYWDSLRNGLLSGEQLYLDLKRLELAYIDQNKREYEITKHISLLLLDPLALITLKEAGTCFIDLPEMFFDMDYPGHYMRRIKSVALTIPCVAGPYTSVNCTLTLLSNKIRIDSNAQGQYTEQSNDSRFVYDFGAIESIATSSAQNDSGMFEVNFRDERYLPFEGDGAISSWRIDLPLDCNAFDFETISDVVIKLNYTAREGGATLQKAARAARDAALHATQTQQSRLFSTKHEFSSEWYRFLHPADTATSQTLALDLSIERFPFLFRGMQPNIQAMKLFLKLKDGFSYSDSKALTFTFGKDGNPGTSSTFKLGGSPISTLPYAEALQGSVGSVGKWILTVQGSDIAKLDPTLQRTVTVNGQNFVHLNPDAIEDLWIVCQYSIK